MRLAPRPPVLAAMLVAVLSTAAARAGDEAPPADPVRAAWAAVQEAAKSFQAAGNDVAKRKEASAVHKTANDVFLRAFLASDWTKYDPVADKEIFHSGLTRAGTKAYWEDADMTASLRAYTALGASFPERAGDAGQMLARVHTALGDMKKAREDLDRALATGDEKSMPATHVMIGNMLAAQGDVDGARTAWKSALAGVPADIDPRRDPRASAKADAEMRLALVGESAPEVDSKTWVGGDPKALSAMKGSVVLVDFWATWCPPCRKVMPGFDALYAKRKAEGLVVLGVTRPFRNGFLPKAGTKDPLREGESIKEIKPEDYVAHLAAFKANVGITYPFVVATEAEPKAYHVSGIPTMAVVDRAGKVAFVAVGADPCGEALLATVVDRLLAPASAPVR